MNKLLVAGVVVLLSFAVSEISAICCGRGKHGFCNDCAKTSLTGHRKCCGSGSGHGYGCNVFCCSCGACRKGHPTITYVSGWFLGKKYSCKSNYGDSESTDIHTLKDTWEAFNEIDLDGNSVVSPDEFLAAIRSRLSDHETAHLLASDLMNSRDADQIQSFLDEVNQDEISDETQEDIGRSIVREFKKMDADNDGFIQAREFDKDLN